MPDHDSSHPPKRRQAVALRYQRGKDVSPRVTASGKGRIAEVIMKKAEEAGVTLMEDPDLVMVLGKIPVGQTVPPALYRAVAEVLAYVYRVNKKFDRP
ncbi:MAG: EscU/YscU/HrcU family type III secretion system export apparatus switch protein [Magnetococcales bacterium]|nr:EscU/YscU/HrcU family type III secretion system export apparatus switch protein [Magnetococcales bacterium]